MLSLKLRRYFATLGARLAVRTEPKGTATTLSLRRDSRGVYFELVLPRLSRRNVEVLATEPRSKRLVLRLARDGQETFVLVRTGTSPSLRAIDAEQVRVLTGELPKLAA